MIKGTGRAWIELDMNNLRHNVNVVRNRLPGACQIMASVKADAYGHGAFGICRELNKLDVRAFCVASIMEGVELRKRHIEGEILVLGYTHPEQFRLLVKYDLTQTVLDLVRTEIEKRGFGRLRAHLQNSYGILNHPDLVFVYASIGRALYGTLNDPGDADRYGVELHPVLSLKARVGAVKTVFTVGYGFTFIAPRDMKIAVLTIGYADGLPRSLSRGAGHVLINGQRAPVLGDVCMDQTMVDVTNIRNVARGDMAVVIGKSGEDEISAYDIAAWAGTISTEILGRLGIRLERIAERRQTEKIGPQFLKE